MAYDQMIGRTEASALVPEDMLMEVFSQATEQSTVLALGRRLRDGTSNQQRLPILSTLPVAYFVTGEAPNGGLKQTTKMAWKNKYIVYEEMAAIVAVPIAVLDDSGFPIWDQVRPELVNAVGLLIDQAVLFGTNKPSSWPGAIVPSAAAAGHSVTLGTGTDIYDDILGENGVYSAVESDGYIVTGNVAHPSFKGKLRGLRDNSGGQPIFMRAQPDGQNLQSATRWELDGAPIAFMRNGAFDQTAAVLISGAWDQLVYSWRRDAQIDVVREGVIQDAEGEIVVNLMQQNLVGIRMSCRFGWELPNPVNRLESTEGGLVGVGGTPVVGRYPFGVLKPAAGSGS